jgi:hypothetical protein
VDADADVSLDERARQDLRSERPAELEQRQPATHRAFGIVLPGFVRAERSEDVVARVLEHLAVVRPDDGGAAPERVVHHGADLFRVEALAQRRRPDDVQKHDADLLEGLLRLAC